jgi:hypothetical protein
VSVAIVNEVHAPYVVPVLGSPRPGPAVPDGFG